MRKSLLIAMITPVIALQSTAQQTMQSSTSGVSDLAIYETVIRFQIKTWELAASTYCVEINGRDAGPRLLQNLAPLPVKPKSACRWSGGKSMPMSTVIDRKTKEPAVIFNVGVIRRVSDSELEVEGGYWCASLCMAEGVYRIVRHADSWRVESFESNVMS